MRDGVKIPLSGAYAHLSMIVDREFEEMFRHHTWYGLKAPRSRTIYARTHIGDQHVYAHHLVNGRPPKGKVTDHENGNGLDNRRGNLRTITQSQNVMAAHMREPFAPAPNYAEGVHTVRKTLKDGTVRVYFYDRKTRARIKPPEDITGEAAPDGKE